MYACNIRHDRRKEREREKKYGRSRSRELREQDRDTIARALGALSTNPLGSSCGHLHDVTRGNSWSLLSYPVCRQTTLTFRERGSLLSLSFAILPPQFSSPYFFIILPYSIFFFFSRVKYMSCKYNVISLLKLTCIILRHMISFTRS